MLANETFLSALAAVEGKISRLEIVDAATAQEAATLQDRLTTAGGLLERTRVELTAPFLAKQREIMEAARAPAERINKSKRALSAKLTAFADAERERIAKLDRERQLELDRLERVRQVELLAEQKRIADAAAALKAKQDADAAAAAALAAKKPAALDVDFGDDDDIEEPPAVVAPPPPTKTEQAIAALKHAPAVRPITPTGIRYVTTLEAIVFDVAQLPDIFVERTPKLAAIKSTFCNGYKEGEPLPELAGVRFEVKRTAMATGR